ncbi:nitrous oxide reductase accessory protein NosL [Phaeovulum sp.]|uniref:nitrous oxide reductase accessory protein NosL n=1 Tax=Phaeovulum sp. TaxID=2934796 RepID=UPI00356A1946
MKRRDFLLTSSIGAAGVLAGTAAHAQMDMQMPMNHAAPAASEYGLTLKLRVDTNPLENEFEKYPTCTYCGMNRMQFSHTRHLIVYENDMVDGTCSIKCAAVGLALNLDWSPKVIYAGDAGDPAEVKPAIDTAAAYYVIDPGKMGTMSPISKWAYSDKAKAEAAAAAPGAVLTDFNGALQAAYDGIIADTNRTRAKRAEKRAAAMKG